MPTTPPNPLGSHIPPPLPPPPPSRQVPLAQLVSTSGACLGVDAGAVAQRWRRWRRGGQGGIWYVARSDSACLRRVLPNREPACGRPAGLGGTEGRTPQPPLPVGPGRPQDQGSYSLNSNTTPATSRRRGAQGPWGVSEEEPCFCAGLSVGEGKAGGRGAGQLSPGETRRLRHHATVCGIQTQL